jgi:Asp-tRNA(Asn)/Glu-tRNA(Gln) amidotransferase A subunit family amidase
VSKKWYNYFVVTEGEAEAGAPVPSNEPGRPAAAPRPAPSPPRRVVDVVPNAEADTEFAAPVSTPTDLAEIYTSAKIATPAHGYTVLKVAEMLQSEHIRALPADVKHKSILVALDAAGEKVAEIVEDAVQRDKALDTFERVLQKHLEDLRSQKEAENKKLEEEINQRVAELRAQIDRNNAEVGREQENLVTWRVRKRREEDRIAEAVGHFVSPNPITTTAPPARDKGGANVR